MIRHGGHRAGAIGRDAIDDRSETWRLAPVARHAIATFGFEHEVHVVAARCENLVSGTCLQARGVLTMDGSIVEINNPDDLHI